MLLKIRVSDFLWDVFKDSGIITVALQFVYYNILFVRQHIQSHSKNSDRYMIGMKNKDKLVTPSFRNINKYFMAEFTCRCIIKPLPKFATRKI